MRYFQKSDKPSVRFFQKSGSAQSFFSKNSKLKSINRKLSKFTYYA